MASASNLKDFHETHGINDCDAPMKDEHNSLLKNDTWDLVPLPKGINWFNASGYIEPSMR